MVTLLRWLAGARGAVRPAVLVSGGVAASAVAVAAALVVGGGGGGTPGTANLFVTSSGCTTSPTRSAARVLFGAAVAANKACTFDQAYQASSQGDTVLVESGTYPAQTVEDNAGHHSGLCDVGNTGPCTTFAPDPSATVVMTDLTNHAWNTYYDGFTFIKTPTTGSPSDGGPSVTQGTGVVMANMNATQFYIQSQSSTNPVVNAHIYKGTFGPLVTCPGGGMVIGDDSAAATWQMPKNVTVEGVLAHDFKITAGCGANHMDCIHARQTTGFFHFIGNREYNCQNYGLLLEGSPDPTWSLLMQNNMVGDSIAGPSSLAYHGGAATDVFPGSQIIVNNSTSEGIGPQPGSSVTGTLTMANNLASAFNSCPAGATLSHNMLSGSSGCGGPTDTLNATFGVTSRATGDMHLTFGAAQIDAGDNTYCPAVDFDYEVRSGTCDVGADQP